MIGFDSLVPYNAATILTSTVIIKPLIDNSFTKLSNTAFNSAVENINPVVQYDVGTGAAKIILSSPSTLIIPVDSAFPDFEAEDTASTNSGTFISFMFISPFSVGLNASSVYITMLPVLSSK